MHFRCHLKLKGEEEDGEIRKTAIKRYGNCEFTLTYQLACLLHNLQASLLGIAEQAEPNT